MSLNGKQRSELRRLGNTMDSVFQLGKDGISEETYRHLDNLLRTRELIKITVLKSCPLDTKEAANGLAAYCSAAVVQVIGRKILLYRFSPELAKEGKGIKIL
ncbi:MAG: YhbY family RNA-binding protein [Clostridia bacterium]|nr:YhbY family RNA-binding protein [Clostridia bacterium]NLF21265.1 YhbY family RNA-binding protein [Clostridiaceae bacterium]